ncbi:arylsulfatase [Pontixanthobacter aquaemixtae]|uniref:Sulfatase-like hydrolase/transferase n=1 Tax=Pontixanthobacter aquaemixtae TaxID=1958940 RepID=A0A844ZSI4_9SPHN|nr:arylsulfatase [Pontixanthobacter aquaemixtae]MXO89966.1 sulfatase-like hydrolase/transferase [Pontixanthobacter aquaemixtae]
MNVRGVILAVFAATALAGTAVAQGGREILPIPDGEFRGRIAEHVNDSEPDFGNAVKAPAGAPNILLFMSDDVGFAMAGTFGGPVPTPNFDRLARKGLRFNRFHTTGICSPSRAALLTGRNHHNAGVGYLADLPNGYPGYSGRIHRSTASIAQVLTLNGYSTAMFGKHHNTPTQERTEAGPFDNWPTGLGFEYFFGFVGGDIDQFSPNLYRGIQRVDPDEAPDTILEKRLADDAIRWIHNQKAGAPDKPFMIYLSPGSTHAPHQAPAEVVARFSGKFDHGWDEERKRIFARQKSAGIIPASATLTPRPEQMPAWDTLTDGQRRFAARSMEAAAAQMAYQDEQLGRIVDELDRMGELEKTLIAIVSGDNGASAEGGPSGTLNEMRNISFHAEPDDWLQANIDEIGGPGAHGNYPVMWAWAMNTPYRWTKQYGSMLGGIRNPLILSWGNRASQPGSVCGRFGHVIDLYPTILDAADLPVPVSVLGTKQKSVDGESLLSSFDMCEPDKPRTQYFEVGGKVGLYHNGWFLSGDDGRVGWKDVPPEGDRPTIKWTLYDLRKDFSQGTDVSQQHTAKLAEMQSLWGDIARANNVFPLDHRFARARGSALHRPSGRSVFEFWGKDVSLPGNVEPMLLARSFTVTATIAPESPDASGVILAIGSRFGGWSLYLDKGRPAFHWARSRMEWENQSGIASRPLPADAEELTMRFVTGRPGGPATVIITSAEDEYLRVELPVNVFTVAGGSETLDIGRDLGVTVTEYRTARGAFEGEIPHIEVRYD